MMIYKDEIGLWSDPPDEIELETMAVDLISAAIRIAEHIHRVLPLMTDEERSFVAHRLGNINRVLLDERLKTKITQMHPRCKVVSMK